MKKVTLLFPDHLTIADYILSEKVRDANVDFSQQTLTAALTEQDIEVAHARYGAVVHPSQDFL
jgi:hypothetical protein